MQTKEAYLVIDIGTGNVRVALVEPNGNVLSVARGDIRYHRDELYPDAIYFEPDQLWEQLTLLGHEAMSKVGNVHVLAITTTSQREGIVLVSKEGKSLIGLPNIDHRGFEWQDLVTDKSRIYELSGRYPTSLFSAFKLEGIQQRRLEIWSQFAFFLSISDWVEYKFTGVAKYEHSQASETLLYDVNLGEWSDELIEVFGIDRKHLPAIHHSGTVSGTILTTVAKDWNIQAQAPVVTGGGDTQLAIKSTQPSVDDIVIVSGTTTPIVKLVNHYITDEQQRTWTSRDIEPNRFIFEANAGVTGLNYQRLKEVFYPNESYDIIEKELAANHHRHCFASLGSLVASERTPVTRGGFAFPVPVSHELSRSSFVWATLLDIAFSIGENYKVLQQVAGHKADHVWACGGGLQSRTLRQLIANIIQKNVQVRHGFEHSSAVGGALLCNKALANKEAQVATDVDSVAPEKDKADIFSHLHNEWQQTRNYFRNMNGKG